MFHLHAENNVSQVDNSSLFLINAAYLTFQHLNEIYILNCDKIFSQLKVTAILPFYNNVRYNNAHNLKHFNYVICAVLKTFNRIIMYSLSNFLN